MTIFFLSEPKIYTGYIIYMYISVCVCTNPYVYYSKGQMKHKFSPDAHSSFQFTSPASSGNKPASLFPLSLNHDEADLSLDQGNRKSSDIFN